MTYKVTAIPTPTSDPASILPTLLAMRDAINTLVRAYNDLAASSGATSLTPSLTAWLLSLPTSAGGSSPRWWNNGGKPEYS